MSRMADYHLHLYLPLYIVVYAHLLRIESRAAFPSGVQNMVGD